MDLEHTYIYGTKIEANANRYTWVWKKSCTKNRGKVFEDFDADQRYEPGSVRIFQSET